MPLSGDSTSSSWKTIENTTLERLTARHFVEQIGCEDVDWIFLAQGRVINLWVL
jgi:hypothetical protein